MARKYEWVDCSNCCGKGNVGKGNRAHQCVGCKGKGKVRRLKREERCECEETLVDEEVLKKALQVADENLVDEPAKVDKDCCCGEECHCDNCECHKAKPKKNGKDKKGKKK